MGIGSIWHWVIVLIIVLLLFGAGRVPRLMGDLAKGIRSFKDGMKSDGAEDEGKTEERKTATIDVKPTVKDTEDERQRTSSKS